LKAVVKNTVKSPPSPLRHVNAWGIHPEADTLITEKTAQRAAYRITFAQCKGGTGKTTACLSVAGWLTKMEKKVLVVDLDSQGNAVSGLGIERSSIDGSMYDVLSGRKTIREIILETDSGVFLAPSSIDLLSVETQLSGTVEDIGILNPSSTVP